MKTVIEHIEWQWELPGGCTLKYTAWDAETKRVGEFLDEAIKSGLVSSPHIGVVCETSGINLRKEEMDLGFIELTTSNGSKIEVAYNKIESMLVISEAAGTSLLMSSGDVLTVKEPRSQIKAKIQVQREM